MRKIKKHLNLLTLVLIIILGFALRLYRIDNPVADWHSWRQADTIAVTQNYLNNGIDLLKPRFNDISRYPSGLPNPEGYRMVEFPIINALTAWSYKPINAIYHLPLHTFSRLVSVIFSLGSLVFLYLIVNHFSGPLTGLIATFFMSVLPYNLYYSHTILPEIPMVFFTLVSTHFFIKSLTSNQPLTPKPLLLSAVFLSLALLLKPYALLFSIPFFYLVFKRFNWQLVKRPGLYLYTLIAITPFLLWRLWIKQFPAGIPNYIWLLNSGEIRFKGAFFQWLFAERLGKLILGFWGLIPFGLGLAIKPKNKEGLFYYFWALGIFAYLSIFAAGNVHHDYYQIITVPIICIFAAKGIIYLLNLGKQNLVAYFLAVISIIFSLAFSWYHIRGYYNINHHEIIAAGKRADQLLPQDAIVVAPYQKDTAFLYQTNRQGWPLGTEIIKKVEKGATHYVSVNFDDETNFLKSICPILEQTNQYVIIDIRHCLVKDPGN